MTNTPHRAQRIGFIGLGAMGAPRARRLISAGYEVTVWNRSPQPAAELAAVGAKVAHTPAELASECGIICSCLYDLAAIEEVYFGQDGVFDGIKPDSVLIEHATFDPEAAKRLAARATEHGVTLLDAPVSGGAEAAELGTLVVMIGGDSAVEPRVRQVLQSFATAIEWVGPSGAGLTLKLLNQMMVTIHSAAAGELAALLGTLGYDQAAAARALGHGWAGSAMLTRNLPIAFEADLSQPSKAPIGGLAEAQRLLNEMMFEASIDAPVFRAAVGQFDAATAQGMGRSDLAALTLLNRQQRERALARWISTRPRHQPDR